MILSELAAKNLSAAIRETLNVAAVIMNRQFILMQKAKEEPWFLAEAKKHGDLLAELDSLIRRLEELPGRIKELKDF